MGSPYKVVSSKGLIDSFRPIIATCLSPRDTGDLANLDPSQMTIIRPTSNGSGGKRSNYSKGLTQYSSYTLPLRRRKARSVLW